jgi:hephaestin
MDFRVVVTSALISLISIPIHGEVITYYIAADEVAWDMTPSGLNEITGNTLGTEKYESVYAKAGPTRIGPVNRKAQYREYTDSTFRTLKPRPKEWEHLGLLGPMLRAEVGDTIRIVFRNNTSFPASMHPHGVLYDKASEGAPYQDGTDPADKSDDAVETGGQHTYVWEVPERAGPLGGRSSIMWMYHSHTDEDRDINTGLMGPILVNAKDMSSPDGTPKDVDREFLVAYWTIDENKSWFVEHNINTYMTNPENVTLGENVFGNQAVLVNGRADFVPNVKETLNGYLYGNLPMLTMQQGERVRWYLMSGTNFELHSPHWHGNVVTWRGMNTDVAILGTMDMGIGDMQPDNPGIWLMHCHIAGHKRAGMIARYEVLPTALTSAGAGQ